jgi:hypothetical protein
MFDNILSLLPGGLPSLIGDGTAIADTICEKMSERLDTEASALGVEVGNVAFRIRKDKGVVIMELLERVGGIASVPRCAPLRDVVIEELKRAAA